MKTPPALAALSKIPPTQSVDAFQILPTQAITDTLLRAGEFKLSDGFNVRSPARKLSLELSLLGRI